MSDFPDIEPFGPRHKAHNNSGEKTGEETIVEATQPVLAPRQAPPYALAVATAFGFGIAVGYLLFKHQESILHQTKLDDFLDATNDWIHEQSPKIADPIRQGLESTGTTFNQAMKSTGSNLDDLIKKVKSGLRV
jgi:hypothetical protein